MNPDDETLALWLEDELEGAELGLLEGKLASHPEWLEMREENRRWKTWMASHMRAMEEPVCPEFFNARVMRRIGSGEGPAAVAEVSGGAERFGGRWWRMPVAAAACVWLGVVIGARNQAPRDTEVDVSGAPKAIPVEPILYTPENGVKARWFDSRGADAYVIVLEGVPAIPDAVDFTRSMSYRDRVEEAEAMVEMSWDESGTPEGGGP